jgi:predicted acyl esterase
MPENPENIEDMVLTWMDKHLRGKNVDTGPEFEYDVITEDWRPGDKQHIRSGDWPLVEKDKETKFVLHSNSKAGDLLCSDNSGWPVPYSDKAESYAANESFSSKVKSIPFQKTSLSEIQGLQGSLNEIYPPFDNPLTSVTFESGEFQEDTEITGIPRIKVWLSSSALDITYFFKLYDTPSAFSSVQWDDPEKVNTDAKVINWHVTPYCVYGSSEDSPQIHEIDLSAITYIIKKGHRIRLTIATSDFFFLHSRKSGDGFIWHDAEHPSALYLPIVR